MEVIIHRIRLRDGVDPARFESWVRTADYAACPELPSIVSFSVHRVSAEPTAPVHFFEVIGVSSQEAFQDDMTTAIFEGLEAGFAEMASVVDELRGERVGTGYHAA